MDKLFSVRNKREIRGFTYKYAEETFGTGGAAVGVEVAEFAERLVVRESPLTDRADPVAEAGVINGQQRAH